MYYAIKNKIKSGRIGLMKYSFYCTVSLFGVFPMYSAFAQIPAQFAIEPEMKVTYQRRLWVTFQMKNIFNEKWSMDLNLPQTRTFFCPWRQDNIFIGALPQWKVLNYQGNTLQVGAGLSYWWTASPQDQFAGKHIANMVREIRPVLSLLYTSPLGKKWKLTHRFWNEFRNFNHHDGKGYEFDVVRWRYLISISYTPIKYLTFTVSNEFFANVINNQVSNIFDQNRILVSVTYHITHDFGVESGYLNWFQQLRGINKYLNQDNVIFTLHYTPNWQNIVHHKSAKGKKMN